MVQVIACYHPDLSRRDDVVDLQGGQKWEVGAAFQGRSTANSVKMEWGQDYIPD